jgi:PKD repeat protein
MRADSIYRRKSCYTALLLILLVILSIPAVTAEPLPDIRHIFIGVANDDGVKYNLDGPVYGGPDNTYYIKADGGGLNELHITNDVAQASGQVSTATNQSGTFYVTNTGGRGFDDDIVLLLAVNGTIPDDFRVHIKTSGYNWTTSSVVNQVPTDYAYVEGAVDETFTKADFIYGPQTWKPGPGTLGVPSLPLYCGQDISDTTNTFQLMFIDLKVGNMYPSKFSGVTLEDNGASKVEFSFTNLTSFATFNGYGWCLAANQGQGISWTNRMDDPGASGFLVVGVPYTPPATPVADFTADPVSGELPLVVQFTDSSTGNPTSWAWDFDNDGVIDSTEQNPLYTYSLAGTFTVNLTTTNGAGSDSEEKTGHITVNVPPAKTWTVGASGCDFTDLETAFANPSLNDGDTVLVSAGTYPLSTSLPKTVTLQGEGREVVTITPVGVVLSGPDTRIDGITFSGGTLSFAGSDTVITNCTFRDFFNQHSLAISGQNTTVSENIFRDNPNRFLIITGSDHLIVNNIFTNNGGSAASMTRFDGCSNVTITKNSFVGNTAAVIGLRCTLSENKIYLNDFIDNSGHLFVFTNNPKPQPIAWESGPITYNYLGTEYTGPLGNYYGSYSGDDADGNGVIDTALTHYASPAQVDNAPLVMPWQTYFSGTGPGPVTPVAAFTANVASGEAPLSVAFTDASSGSPTAWAWDFGDGATSSEQNATHTYTTAGTYTVNLTVTGEGVSDSEVKTDYITVAPHIQRTWTVGAGGCDFTEIWDALANPQLWDGDTIFVYNGTYNDPDSGSIRLYRQIRLVGEGREDVLYNAGRAKYFYAPIEIEGISFMNSSRDFDLRGVNSIVHSCTFDNFSNKNFYANNIRFENNIVNGGGYIRTGFSIYPSNNNIVANNSFNNMGRAIWLGGSNQTIIDNTFTGCGGSEVVFIDQLSGSMITRNRFIASPGSVLRMNAPGANLIYFNDFESTNPIVYNGPQGVISWNATLPVTYTYQGASYTGYPGNYWIDYTGTDGDGNGLGDEPFMIPPSYGDPVHYDYAPLMGSYTSYLGGSAPQPPAADFTASPLSGDAPLGVQFTDTSAGNPTSWAWDFENDGIVDSTEQNPTFTYTAAGTYTVNLTVTNAASSDSDVKTDYITVSNGGSGGETGLADSAWPKLGGADLSNTGRSPYVGAQTNATKWVYSTGGQFLSAVPVIGSDGTVYVGNYDKNVYAINPDGSLKWTYTAGNSFSGPPAISADGTIYIGNYLDKMVYALNPDGTLKWTYNATAIINGGPTIGPDGTIYIGNNEDTLYALNPDGTKKWSYPCGGTYSIPAIGPDGTIYFGADMNLCALNPDGTLKWSYVTGGAGATIYGSPVIGPDGMIYFGSNDKNLYALNPDGTLNWAYTTGGTIRNSPVMGMDGTIYFGNEGDKKIYALNPDGTLKWTYLTGGRIRYASPAIGADGTIYIGSADKKFYALNPDGTLKWFYETGKEIAASPSIAPDGTVYIASKDGNVYAFDGVVNVTADTSVGQVPLTVNFQGTSPLTVTAWNWDFGDGTTSTEQNPSHTYFSAGTYTVNLTITHASGTNYIVQTVTVPAPAGSPVPDFTANVTEGTAPLKVQFTDLSTGSPTSWSWDFGDGTGSTDQNPVHTYTTAGTYTVNLTAINDGGSNSEIKTDYISVSGSSGASILPDYNYIFVRVANDDGVKYNAFGNDTYNIRFEGVNRGLNALHISTDPAVNFGQVTVTDSQSGTFYATDSGGKGYEDEVILLVAVNGTIPDDFSLRITSDGYTWTPNPVSNQPPSLDNVTYQPVALDETFTKEDFIYGPQTWKPTGNEVDYPIYAGQDLTDTNNTFHLMFIDLNAGVLRPNTDLENQGAVQINYTFANLDSFAAFSVYAYCQISNNGDDMVAWSNALTPDKAMSGYSVFGKAETTPVAYFTANSTSGTAPLSVSFTDTSTGSPTAWAWSFGDGYTSAEQNPAHTYASDGSYQVNLTVSNAAGSDTGEKPGYITVTSTLPEPPVVNFIGDNRTGPAPLTVHFTDQSTNTPTAWAWDFENDGIIDSTDQNPTHTYTSAGTYQVNLTASNAGGSANRLKGNYIQVTSDGNSNPVVDFSADSRDGTAPFTVQFTDLSVTAPTAWAWDFENDGVIDSTLQNPAHTYTTAGTYQVNLSVTNTSGTANRLKANYIRVSSPSGSPVASFTANPETGRAPSIVRFTDTSTGDGITGYEWDFGDGATSTQENPSHLYRSPGTYTIILNVISGTGTVTATGTIKVTGGSTTPAGTVNARFTSSPSAGRAPLEVQFTDRSSGATTWNWDFGDGGTSTEQNPSHTYTTSGTYKVTLSVSGTDGSDTSTGTIMVIGTSTLPGGTVKSQFTSSPSVGRAPLEVQFTDRSSGATTWNWDFGDGGTSTEPSPVHVYMTTGTYKVTLSVSGADGSDTSTGTIMVIGGPSVNPGGKTNAQFTASPTVGRVPLEVQFTDHSSWATNQSWDFGDGMNSTDMNPLHIFNDKGTYKVTLTVTIGNNIESATDTIWVI